MSDPTIDREIERNEERAIPTDKREDRAPSIVETVEDAVSTFAKPLSNQRVSEEDVKRHREANDAEQRE
jgi:hypothetical protein